MSWIGWLLIVTAVGLGGAIALPLLIAPLAWARWLGWTVPQERALATYLGRCLGGVAIAILYAAVRAAPDPAAHPLLLELFVIAGALLTGVHVWGAIARAQPRSETYEIALYAALTVLFAIARASI